MRNLASILLFSLTLFAFQAAKTVADAKAKVKAAKFDEAITELDTALKGKATPAETTQLKAALAEAHLAQGNATMFNEQLPPMRKYPAALRSFRKVLEYDKNNAMAKKNIDTIEGVYKSMGRPVPQ